VPVLTRGSLSGNVYKTDATRRERDGRLMDKDGTKA
jgi:hypothetical protein